MSPWLSHFLSSVIALAVPLAAHAEPLPRSESNVSIRNEVQLALDKGFARLASTQRADGTWGKVGVTGFALLALQRDPRGRGLSFKNDAEFQPLIEKGFAGLRETLARPGDLRKMDDLAWNLPPAMLSLDYSRDPRDVELRARGVAALGESPLPAAPETLALFLSLDPKARTMAKRPPNPPTGSAMAAWLWSKLEHALAAKSAGHLDQLSQPATDWLRDHYTLERNPEGDGVHQYYFWLSSVLESPTFGFLGPVIKLPDGRTVDIPRQLAEKLVNDQNANGSWSGVGEHWTEKDPDLVTALCLITLERVYRQL